LYYLLFAKIAEPVHLCKNVHMNVYDIFIVIGKTWKQPRHLSMEKCKIYNGILFSDKKSWKSQVMEKY
jgi:hypothetical protein